MKKRIVLIVAAFILMLTLFTGCVQKNVRVQNNTSYVSSNSYGTTIYVSFSVNANKSTNKITYDINVYDTYGAIIERINKIHEININEDKDDKGLVNFDYAINYQSRNAYRIMITNLECHYDANWAYGLFGLFGGVGFIALVSCFTIVKIKDKKNNKV